MLVFPTAVFRIKIPQTKYDKQKEKLHNNNINFLIILANIMKKIITNFIDIKKTNTLTIGHQVKIHTVLYVGDTIFCKLEIFSRLPSIYVGSMIWRQNQSRIFARKYVKKNSLSDRKKLVFLSLITLLKHWLTVAIEENERSS